MPFSKIKLLNLDDNNLEKTSLRDGNPIRFWQDNNNNWKLETDIYEFKKIFISYEIDENTLSLQDKLNQLIRIQMRDIYQKWMKIVKDELKFVIYYHYLSEDPTNNLGSNKSKKSASFSSHSDVDKISALTNFYEERIKKQEIENHELKTLLENSVIKFQTQVNISKFLEEAELKNHLNY